MSTVQNLPRYFGGIVRRLTSSGSGPSRGSDGPPRGPERSAWGSREESRRGSPDYEPSHRRSTEEAAPSQHHRRPVQVSTRCYTCAWP